MKEALCIRSLSELSQLVSGDRNIIYGQLVPRDICEKIENGYLQLIPYVVFYTTDVNSGKVRFVQYVRPDKGSENRLVSKTSIGFGGHIDGTDEVKCYSHSIEHDRLTFALTLNNIIETSVNCSVREVTEELGVNVFDALDVKIITDDAAFFMGDPKQEVNKVHLALLIPVKLNADQFEQFFKIITCNKEEISAIDLLGININTIVEEMDVSLTLNKIENELSHKLNLEDWSCKAMSFIIKKEINSLMKNVSYTDIVSLTHMKEEVSDVAYSVDPETKAVTKVQEQSEAEDLEEQGVAPV